MEFNNQIDTQNFDSKVDAYIDIANKLSIITDNQLKLVNDLFTNIDKIKLAYQDVDFDSDEAEQQALNDAIGIVINALPDVSSYNSSDAIYIISRVAEFGLFVYANSAIEHSPEFKAFLVFANDTRRALCTKFNLDLQAYGDAAQAYMPTLDKQTDLLNALLANKNAIINSINNPDPSKLDQVSFAVVNQFVPLYEDAKPLTERFNLLAQTLEIALALFQAQELQDSDSERSDEFLTEIRIKTLQRIN